MSASPFVNPVDVIVEMLTAALPGFESAFIKDRDAVGIRGALPIRAEVSAEAIMFPVMMAPRFEHPDDVDRSILAALAGDFATGPEINLAAARERKRVERELEPMLTHITAHVRGLGIAALGLGPVMERERQEAREQGRREGRVGGFEDGKREGRREAIRELVAALGRNFDEAARAMEEFALGDDYRGDDE